MLFLSCLRVYDKLLHKTSEKPWNITQQYSLFHGCGYTVQKNSQKCCGSRNLQALGWGEGGLTPREAAREVFHFEDFQHIVDPLEDPNEEIYGELFNEEKVS